MGNLSRVVRSLVASSALVTACNTFDPPPDHNDDTESDTPQPGSTKFVFPQPSPVVSSTGTIATSSPPVTVVSVTAPNTTAPSTEATQPSTSGATQTDVTTPGDSTAESSTEFDAGILDASVVDANEPLDTDNEPPPEDAAVATDSAVVDAGVDGS